MVAWLGLPDRFGTDEGENRTEELLNYFNFFKFLNINLPERRNRPETFRFFSSVLSRQNVATLYDTGLGWAGKCICCSRNAYLMSFCYHTHFSFYFILKISLQKLVLL